MNSELKTMSNGKDLINCNISERKNYNGFNNKVRVVLSHTLINPDQRQNRSG